VYIYIHIYIYIYIGSARKRAREKDDKGGRRGRIGGFVSDVDSDTDIPSIYIQNNSNKSGKNNSSSDVRQEERMLENQDNSVNENGKSDPSIALISTSVTNTDENALDSHK
jgi:hypothetical protein